MEIPVKSQVLAMDPIAELVSDFLNYPQGQQHIEDHSDVDSDLKEEQEQHQTKYPSENIRLAVEILLAAEVDSPAYRANLEIAKGYISKEIALSSRD